MIEDVDDLAEWLADQASIYGICPDRDTDGCSQDTYCRICWIMEVKRRMRDGPQWSKHPAGGPMALTPAQAERLKQFARACLAAASEAAYDSADVQDLAVELGLVRADQATQADCDDGFEGETGDRIYRLVHWLAPDLSIPLRA